MSIFLSPATLALLLSLSAGAGTTPAVGAETGKLRTLVSTNVGIDVFVQDADSIGWIDSGHAVHVARLSKPSRAVVGWLETDVIGGGPVAPARVGARRSAGALARL